jgi:Spy/CpxP family protein refolding chaperone
MEVSMFRKILVVMMVFSLAGSVAFAQDKKKHGDHGKDEQSMMGECSMMHGCGMMGNMNIDVLKKQLKLTDEQTAKIKTLITDHKKEMLTQKEVLAPQEIKLQRILMEEPVNLDEVKSLVMEISKVRGEMHFAMIKNRLEVEKILTPEQREKFKNMHKMHGPMKKEGQAKKEGKMKK